MITLFHLFLLFFKIGILSFGGGYAIIAMVQTEAMTFSTLNVDSTVMANLISIASTTPGAVGINMAAAFGHSVYGITGAIVAVISIVFPSIIIVTFLASLFNKIEKFSAFNEILRVVHPTVAAIIIYVALSFALKNDIFFLAGSMNFKAIIIATISIFLLVRKMVNPIVLIVLGGVCGFLFF